MCCWQNGNLVPLVSLLPVPWRERETFPRDGKQREPGNKVAILPTAHSRKTKTTAVGKMATLFLGSLFFPSLGERGRETFPWDGKQREPGNEVGKVVLQN